MEIIRHHHQDDILQRSVVKVKHVSYCRIARLMESNGEFCPDILDRPIWQERVSTGEFQTVMNPARVAELERAFIEQVILESQAR